MFQLSVVHYKGKEAEENKSQGRRRGPGFDGREGLGFRASRRAAAVFSL